MLQERLRLIKQRHRELILKPREELLSGFIDEDEDALHMADEAQELQMLESYGWEADF